MTTAENTTTPVLLNAQEVADMLRVSRSHVMTLARSGELPAIKLGHTWRFHKDAVEKVIASGLPE